MVEALETVRCGQQETLRCAVVDEGWNRALVHDPPTMLLDEPTLGMDVVASQVVFDYIDMVRQSGKSIILCTHRLEQAETIIEIQKKRCKGHLSIFISAETSPPHSDYPAGALMIADAGTCTPYSIQREIQISAVLHNLSEFAFVSLNAMTQS